MNKNRKRMILAIIVLIIAALSIIGFAMKRANQEEGSPQGQNTYEEGDNSQQAINDDGNNKTNENQPDDNSLDKDKEGSGENQEGDPSGVIVEGSFITLPSTINGTSIEISDIQKYSGTVLERGIDAPSRNVVAAIITNNSSQMLQYMELELQINDSDKRVHFEVSTLPAGASVMVTDINLNEYNQGDKYIIADKLIAYCDTPSLMEDTFKITSENGKLTVENVSTKDYSGVYIYYKYVKQGIYIGGITYRSVVDTIKSGESKTIDAGHYNVDSSEIMMITTD